MQLPSSTRDQEKQASQWDDVPNMKSTNQACVGLLETQKYLKQEEEKTTGARLDNNTTCQMCKAETSKCAVTTISVAGTGCNYNVFSYMQVFRVTSSKSHTHKKEKKKKTDLGHTTAEAHKQ